MRLTSFALLFLIVTPSLGRLHAADKPKTPVPDALQSYVNRADDSFAWKRVRDAKHDAGTVHDLEVTSQTWQGITWKHVVQVFSPTGDAAVRHPKQMLLFITGGNIGQQPKDDQVKFGLTLARLCQARVAVLYQVPNQPLLGGKREDDLISDTYLKYLETKDATWPLLFPMVKSATRTMDALQQFADSEWKQPVDGFVVSGASKRGWTTWLSAVADRRVIGIAPMVIDTLNFHAQQKYQLETWGKYSEQIDDYTRKGLMDVIEKQPDNPLWRWVDPYTYREQLTLPKLMINGTNDRYWCVDALNQYWDGLVGPKHVHYVPNAGHGLENNRDRALQTLGAFFHTTARRESFPALEWKHTDEGGRFLLAVKSSSTPVEAKLWTARSASKDFRESKWQFEPLRDESGRFTGSVTKPDGDHVALFGELTFRLGELTYSLATQIRRE
jgi:PhoPQ-activated pathogenicity-related protein